MASFGVVLDTCVLYPMPIADTLLLAAQRGLYAFRWADDLFVELEKVMHTRGKSAEQAKHRVETMRAAFAESQVLGYHSITGGIRRRMPDPDDAHVLAAAIRSGAELIVTFNLSDFPPNILAEYGVRAHHPDDFLYDLVDIYPADVIALLRHQADQKKQPPMTFEQLLTKLEKDAPKFVAQVRQVLQIAQSQASQSEVTEGQASPANVIQMGKQRRAGQPYNA